MRIKQNHESVQKAFLELQNKGVLTRSEKKKFRRYKQILNDSEYFLKIKQNKKNAIEKLKNDNPIKYQEIINRRAKSIKETYSKYTPEQMSEKQEKTANKQRGMKRSKESRERMLNA